MSLPASTHSREQLSNVTSIVLTIGCCCSWLFRCLGEVKLGRCCSQRESKRAMVGQYDSRDGRAPCSVSAIHSLSLWEVSFGVRGNFIRLCLHVTVMLLVKVMPCSFEARCMHADRLSQCFARSLVSGMKVCEIFRFGAPERGTPSDDCGSFYFVVAPPRFARYNRGAT